MPSSRRLVIIAAVAAAVGVLAFVAPWFYANVLANDPPEAFELSNPVDHGTGEPFDVDGTWAVADGSAAGYRVDEILNGQDVTVVGRTADVRGDLAVAGGTLTSADVVVDLTTVTTDSASRDGQFATTILQTTTYPEATFALTEPVDLGALADGDAIDVTAVGALTIRDTTVDVGAELRAQGSDDTVEVVGSIPLVFGDVGITAPDLGFVKVADHGFVEFHLMLARR